MPTLSTTTDIIAIVAGGSMELSKGNIIGPDILVAASAGMAELSDSEDLSAFSVSGDFAGSGDVVAVASIGLFKEEENAVVYGDSIPLLASYGLLDIYDWESIDHHSPAYILGFYLKENTSLVTKPSNEQNWTLYISAMPSRQGVKDKIISIYDTTGLVDQRLPDNFTVEHYGISLQVRAFDYNTAYRKVERIQRALLNLHNEVISIEKASYRINSISKTTPITSLGVESDNKRRFLFSSNYLMSMTILV